MTPEQQKEIKRWNYLVKGIDSTHANNWLKSIQVEQGAEQALLFAQRCNYINKPKMIFSNRDITWLKSQLNT